MFKIDSTVLLVIDVQGKLASLMYDREQTISNIQGAIKAAKIFGVPIIWTEQVPGKIGPTIPEIQSLLGDVPTVEKSSFSCYLNDQFKQKLESTAKKQVLVVGIETHVCVYQTVCDLIDHKYEVEVIADAVSSRTKENKDLALKRIEATGAKLTSLEMVVTELLRTAEHPNFKEVLSLIK